MNRAMTKYQTHTAMIIAFLVMGSISGIYHYGDLHLTLKN